MKICFPVQENQAVESIVYSHFGSAPLFIVVDTATNAVSTINNRDQHHVHGACSPLKALDNQQIDAVIVGGIGAGALGKLNQTGIRVYRSQSSTVRENLALFASGGLAEFALQSCCGGHSHAGGCSH